MNALKHGLRSKREALLREDSCTFENAKVQWMAKVDASDDMAEFLAYQTVSARFAIEHAQCANEERIATLHETAEDTAIEAVNELGRRLFFDRRQSAVYGNLPEWPSKKERDRKTSTSGDSADADDPAKLVATLRQTPFGCIWLRARWEDLLDQLVPGTVFQGQDRFRAIRLSGRQPNAASTERAIALIFIASHVLYRQGKTAFDDLLSDMDVIQLETFEKHMKARWPDLFEITDKEEAREILTDIIEQNITRLNDIIDEFEKNADKIAQRSRIMIKHDDTPAGHRMRNYIERANDALNRRMAKYDKYKDKEKNKDRDDWNPRRMPGECSRFDRGQAQWMPEVTKDCILPEDVDLSWAYEDRPAEVSGLANLTVNENDKCNDSGGTLLSQDDEGLKGGVIAAAAPEDGMSALGGKAQDFTNEPKSDKEAIELQQESEVGVATEPDRSPALDNLAGFSTSGGRQLLVDLGEVAQPQLGSVGVETGSQEVEDRARDVEVQRLGSQVSNRMAGSGIPAAKTGSKKSERKRRRRERERQRIERREIERQLERPLLKGPVTSASNLIEETLWPASEAGGALGLELGRSP